MPLSRSLSPLRCETRFGAFDARCLTCWGSAFLITFLAGAFALLAGVGFVLLLDFISNLYTTIR